MLGGGLVPGSLVLLGGEPGIGKSTLLLQVAAGLAAGPGPSAARALRDRRGIGGPGPAAGGRLGLLDADAGERVRVVAEHEVGRIAEDGAEPGPGLVVVDSIQTATVDELDGAAGSVGQVRESALRLMEVAKGEGIAVVLVGHVTKDGSIAGPKTLEHLVDAVLDLEGERIAALRLLRAAKNRFGSTEEVGVFEMRDAGLVEVADPARAFLGEHADRRRERRRADAGGHPTVAGRGPGAGLPGAATGTRSGRASGIDPNRLALLVAVLGRRAGDRPVAATTSTPTWPAA